MCAASGQEQLQTMRPRRCFCPSLSQLPHLSVSLTAPACFSSTWDALTLLPRCAAVICAALSASLIPRLYHSLRQESVLATPCCSPTNSLHRQSDASSGQPPRPRQMRALARWILRRHTPSPGCISVCNLAAFWKHARSSKVSHFPRQHWLS